MQKRIQRHYQRLKAGGNLKALATLANVSSASVSRIVSGKNAPSLDKLRELALELGPQAGAELMADHFRDLLPHGLKRKVHIEVVPKNKRCLETTPLPNSFEMLPARGRRMIERLLQLCIENPELLEAFADEVDLLFDPHES